MSLSGHNVTVVSFVEREAGVLQLCESNSRSKYYSTAFQDDIVTTKIRVTRVNPALR